jgi:hypothetical protein
VHVLGIDSDDAEDQADALTGAIRSRVRGAPGWSLQETQHTLGMLTAALRCPPKPDAPCLQRIGDQLHADRFVWGLMSKAPGNQVTVEIHLWSRGRPDTSDKETYSDNLQDQNDETLRRIATRILDKISGTVTTGTVTVHAGEGDGVVWINGQKNHLLDHGAATIALVPGKYDVEVRAQGFTTAKQEGVAVAAGLDTSVSLKLDPAAPASAEPPKSESTVDGRRIAGWALIGVGVAAGAVAAIEGIEFISAKNDLDAARAQVPSQITDVCNSNEAFSPSAGQAATACSKYNQAATDRTVGVIVGSVGAVALAVGAVLLITDHSREGSATPATGPTATTRNDAPKFRLLPYFNPPGGGRTSGGGLKLSVTF